ncbi:MAG: 2,3-bisphosphoglycerate-independent phosphoglycerate mutase [Flavobacteriaceae bacterium]|nr:2,3-bisphosphoglycerate-independent phosphoglycerate mutase [Flavobacteriaceae bacterium]
MAKKVILMILDGWGITQNPEVSAVFKAKTTFIDGLTDSYAYASLRTDGEHVGLPVGQMGNSEVGHMNLGAGRVVYQNLVKINKAVAEKTLGQEKVLLDAIKYAKENNKNIHLLGLVSDGGIHSHINHLKGMLDVMKENNAAKVFVHAFTDGRDCDPKSAVRFMKELEEHMEKTTGEIATLSGRYFAMDRDKRWERVKIAYDALVNGVGEKSTNAVESLNKSYANNVTDEFLQPIIMTDAAGNAKATISEDDVVIYFNYRTDRGREFTDVLTQHNHPDLGMKTIPLHFVTMTNYDETFTGLHVIYNNDNLENTLGEVLANAGKKQIRIAETEKYPHVTFFFSGGREKEFDGESRILRNSPKVATYDLQPEMSAFEIKDAIIPELDKQEVDFVCLNFANGDMVGHTGIMEAAIIACQTVDKCVEEVITSALKNDYTTIIIADHGNCETMINPDGSPNTAHTTNPVPMILVDKDIKTINPGVLGNIAPTILELMGLEKPSEMKLESLL